MDSLLANYASSDEEEEQQQETQQPPKPQPKKTPSSSSLFSSLPKPQSSSLFSSLPPPKSQNPGPQSTPKTPSSPISTSQNHRQQEEEKGLQRELDTESRASSALFSSLPTPKSQSNSGSSSGSGSTTQKRVVQFRPPIIQTSYKSDNKDDDDDEDGDDEYLDKKPPQVINPTPSFKSFISSMPAPSNSATLGSLSGSGGSGRRAIVETSAPSLNTDVHKAEKEVGIGSGGTSIVQDSSNDGSISGSLGAAEGQFVAGGDATNWGQPSEGYVGYESYGNYGGYPNYESYGNDVQYDQNSWANTPSTWVTPEASGAGIVENLGRVSGKRGRNHIPTEIVEVSQDELMKNRPRQDQVKLTGIAFGPAYQPAPSGGGNKPTKLHKRKHQIGSLYFDMRQKEMELSERRAKGMLTKAETQAKYGW